MPKNMDTEVWESLGEQDPDWAVESRTERKHGGWADSLDEFYESGRTRVLQALEMAGGVTPVRALDWGSGTGRLSFTLSEKFERVTCVDISTSMQSLLEERARERGIENLDLVTVEAFEPLGDHDFALSLITMQHFSDRQSVEAAIRAMVAALRPGGSIVIEIPIRAHTLRYRVQPRRQLYRVLRRLGASPKRLHARGLSGIRMLCIPTEWVTAALESAGAHDVEVKEHRGTSHQVAWYAAKRRVGTA